MIWRSRWAAIGAAVAVTLGGGGLVGVGAASPESTFVAITPTRVLDTRFDIGLTDAFEHRVGRDLDVTGTIAIVGAGNVASTGSVVPDGATAIVANVTAVNPTTAGFVAVRPGTATGDPTTSNLNFSNSGVVVPNSVTVELPTAGTSAGTVNLFFSGTGAGATAHLLVDIVGYYVEGAGAPGPKGDQGDPGQDGADGADGGVGPPGAQGDTGPAAWDLIPSGTTVTGTFAFTGSATTTNQLHFHSVSLPGRAAADLTFDKVNFSTEPDAMCTGTAGAPTAPAGEVCIYMNGSDNIHSPAGAEMTDLLDQAFLVAWFNFDSGSMTIGATWAYTAP